MSKDSARLDLLAYNYYGDRKLWWVIAKANGIRGKIALKAGQILRIPGNITKIIDDFDDDGIHHGQADPIYGLNYLKNFKSPKVKVLLESA